MAKEKIAFSWSGGKDSALALHRVLQSGQYEVCYLLTTVNSKFKRISMHGVREELLDLQAASIGIPLVKIYVSEGTNKEYEKKMEETLLKFKSEGIKRIGFGDIFLEDLRAYRDTNMAKVGMTGFYPLWKESTTSLIREFLDLNFKTITCCVNGLFLNEDNVGKIIGNQFIKELPKEVDVCGENGEFHTFVFEGPIFKKTIEIEVGEKVYKPLEIRLQNEDSDTDHPPIEKTKTKGFWFCDLLPA
jgi:uncharacterized protein (TIGR00290 family)